jgi:hypothetical protein
MTPGTGFDSLAPCQRATDARLPSGSGCAVAAEGDLDGDHKPDSVLSYASLGPDGRATAWLLRTVLGSGATSQVQVEDPYQFAVLGTADVNGDGRQEVFARVNLGASTEFAGVYTLDDRGRLVPVAEQGRGPLQLALAGSVTHGNGGSCTLPDGSRGLVLRKVERFDVGPYQWQETDYEWEGTVVRATGSRQGTIDSPDGSDTRLAPFYEFTCGDLRIP